MIYQENYYRMAVVGFCNALPSLKSGMNPANVLLKATIDGKYIYQIKGNERVVIQVKYDKQTKRLKIDAREFPMDVDFE